LEEIESGSDFYEWEIRYKLEVAAHMQAAGGAIQTDTDWVNKIKEATSKNKNLSTFRQIADFREFLENDPDGEYVALSELWDANRASIAERIHKFSA